MPLLPPPPPPVVVLVAASSPNSSVFCFLVHCMDGMAVVLHAVCRRYGTCPSPPTLKKRTVEVVGRKGPSDRQRRLRDAVAVVMVVASDRQRRRRLRLGAADAVVVVVAVGDAAEGPGRYHLSWFGIPWWFVCLKWWWAMSRRIVDPLVTNKWTLHVTSFHSIASPLLSRLSLLSHPPVASGALPAAAP